MNADFFYYNDFLKLLGINLKPKRHEHEYRPLSEVKHALGVPGVDPDLQHSNKECLTFALHGSAKDRRRQYRALCRKYAGAQIERHGKLESKDMPTGRVIVEDANSAQSIVRVRLNEGK